MTVLAPRPIKLLVVAVFIGTALLTAPSAQAEASSEDRRYAPAFLGPHFAEMREIAEAWFPTACVPELWATDDPSTEAIAWASAPLLGSWRCAVTFNQPWFDLGIIEQCKTVIHEWGHLAGLDHNGDPTSIMYEEGSWSAPDPPACLAIGRRAARIEANQWRRQNKRLIIHQARISATNCARSGVAAPPRCRDIVWAARVEISDVYWSIHTAWDTGGDIGETCVVRVFFRHGQWIRYPVKRCRRSVESAPRSSPEPTIPEPRRVGYAPIYVPV